jgi:ABC-type multidrug transport system permease subunit
MTIKIFSVFKRNLQIYSNSKLSSLIFILGPLLLIFIVGASLQDTSLKNINAGIYPPEDDWFTTGFKQSLREKSFNLKEEKSLEECKGNVINGNTHVCIHLEQVFGVEMLPSGKSYESYNVNLYVDFSKPRVVWNIIGNIQEVVEQESDQRRSVLINDLKDDLGSLNTELTSGRSGLNTLIYRVDQLERDLNNIQNSDVVIQNKVEEIKGGIIAIRDNLIPIQSQLDNNQEIGIILGILDKVEGDLETIEANTNQGDTQNILTNVKDIRNRLSSLQNSLNNLENNLDQIENVNVDRLSNPITLTYKSASDEQEGSIEKKPGFLDYLFPSFLIFFILFGSIIFATIVVIKERSSRAYIRNITSKNKGFVFLIGNFLTCIALISLQISIIVIVSKFFLNINPFTNLISLISILLISISIFILIGIALGYIFNSYESAIIASISIALLFFIFSSIVTPSEILPKTIYKIINLSPLTLLETKLRLNLIFNIPLKIFFSEFISILSVLIISIILISIFYKRSKEKEI